MGTLWKTAYDDHMTDILDSSIPEHKLASCSVKSTSEANPLTSIDSVKSVKGQGLASCRTGHKEDQKTSIN